MNDKSAKALAAYAAGVQAVTIIFTYLLYVNQEAVKTFFSGTEIIAKVHTVPVDRFIVCICPAVLYFIFAGFQIYAEKNDNGRKAAGIFFFVIACIMEIVLEYVPKIGSMLAARMGASALASHSVLDSAISICTRPFSIVAFGLFALSVGGCLFEAREQKPVNSYDDYFK